MNKFNHHKYTWTNRFSICHDWSFVGPAGAINFHVHISKSDGHRPSAGLEFHHTRASWKGETKAPDHVPCQLLGEPCWHEGTSLYATETLWPMIEPYLQRGEHEHIFKLLETEYNRYFERTEE